MKNSASDIPEAPSHAGRAKGMTLMELLLALAIASLLMGLVFSISSAILLPRRSRDQGGRAGSQTAFALKLLRNDLASCAAVDSPDEAVFVLEPATNEFGGSSLNFIFAVPCNWNGHLIYDVARVCYARSDESCSRRALTRTTRPLSSAGEDDSAQEVEVIAENITLFQVEVFDGSNWTNSWGSDPEKAWPMAARIMLATGDEPVSRMATEVLIPVGHMIKKREEQNPQTSGAF